MAVLGAENHFELKNGFHMQIYESHNVSTDTNAVSNLLIIFHPGIPECFFK